MESEPPIFKLRRLAEEHKKELDKMLFEKTCKNILQSRQKKQN